MAKNVPSISDSELEVLKVLWEQGPASVREVWDELAQGRWAYTTVQTLLQRLEGKGCVASEKRERLRIYRAAVSRDQLVQDRVGNLMRELCDGSPMPLMQGLVQGKTLSADQIDEFRALLDAQEAQSKKRRRKK